MPAGPFDAPDDDPILEGLNPDQREAVLHHDGPLLVIAGAGSGKTRVLTHRIAHLIRAHGVSPFEILAITFTNKAADEMKHRVGALVGPVAEKMWVSTFHSACVRILRRDAKRLGYPSSFTIYDQADAVRLTGYVVRDLNLDPKRFPPRSVHATISAAKNDAVSVEEYGDRAQGHLRAQDRRRLRRVPEAPAHRRRHGLRRPAPGHRRAAPRRARGARRTTSAGSSTSSSTSTRTPTRSRTSSCSCSPPSTATSASSATPTSRSTGSAGADIRNINEFEEAFPDATVIVLDQNYRSTQNILDAANAVIANNLGRKPKELWTESGAGELLVRYHADDEGDEAQWVAHEIGRLHDEGER